MKKLIAFLATGLLAASLILRLLGRRGGPRGGGREL